MPLVISRKVDQRIIISDHITVTVTRIKGSQIQLAITAPREVNIRRGELADERQEQGQ